MSTPPKVFVSYSHDSLDHKKWVFDLSSRLAAGGVNVILDQWELKPGDDIPHYMETHLADCDFVMMVCTENYVEKANAGSGGVGYEKMIVTASLMESIDSSKAVPVIKQDASTDVPTFLGSKMYVDMSNTDKYEFGFDELLRTFHGTAITEKPEIGENPFAEAAAVAPEPQHDSFRDVMRIIVSDFESHSRGWTFYSQVVERSGLSRILLDVMLEQIAQQGLIQRDDSGDIWLTEAGKQYAINNNLIS